MVIRLGIIGLSADESAWATTAHAVSLKALPLSKDYSITAIAISSPASAKAAAKFHAVPEDKAYSSAEAIANDPEVDMVVVSVKVPLHKPLTVPALKAKKDVFVEYPLGAGLQEAEELAALAKKQGVRTVVGLQFRFTPAVLKAKDIIDSGGLGRIMSTSIVASTSMFSNLSAKHSYINDPTSDANIVTIPTAHTLDSLCFLLGEFTTLNATAATALPTLQIIQPDSTRSEPEERKTPDSIVVQGVLESGALAAYSWMATTEATPDRLEWIIAGEKASLKIEAPKVLLPLASTTLSQYTPGESAKWEVIELPDGSMGGVGEVYAAFAEGKGRAVDFDGAVKRQRMMDTIMRSAASGTRESY